MYQRVILFMFQTMLLAVLVTSCHHQPIPKPKGFLRIDLPQKSYQNFDTAFPYSFQYPTYSFIKPAQKPVENPYWIDIVFPKFKATIYLSYKPIHDNLRQYTEDSRTFVMKHIPKASSIEEFVVENPENNVYGLIWLIKGQEAASPCQFYLTDSNFHFLRGALYYDFYPNNDSLSPITDFLILDIQHIAQTLKWENTAYNSASK